MAGPGVAGANEAAYLNLGVVSAALAGLGRNGQTNH
jgi:hypothetical protein